MEELVAGTLSRRAAEVVLDVCGRTLRRYLHRYRQAGAAGLRDHHGGSRPRLTGAQQAAIVASKQARPHRSARKIRDLLRLPVSVEAVRLVLVRHGLARLGLPPVKPVQRFVAAAPNALWQIDIMGRVRFPLIGDLYLMLALDDHSRFVLAGGFFPRKFRINLFTVMYAAFTRWGLPQALLSDRESHFKPTRAPGEADYQYYARRLGIHAVYARRARTKGKIERLFRFIQHDFVLEHIERTSVDKLSIIIPRINKKIPSWRTANTPQHLLARRRLLLHEHASRPLVRKAQCGAPPLPGIGFPGHPSPPAAPSRTVCEARAKQSPDPLW